MHIQQPDPCLSLVQEHHELDPEQLIQFLIKFTGLAKRTPRPLVETAVAEEIHDLVIRALGGLARMPAEMQQEPLLLAAREQLEKARASTHIPHWPPKANDPVSASFPREELVHIAERAGAAGLETLVDELRIWIDKHRAFEARLRWLVNGTDHDEVAGLDPIADCDRIHHHLSSVFRVEGRILELLMINRIAQSSSISLFFRSTAEAERNPIYRFYDTFNLYANFIEWGADSKRGRAAIARMSQIHGRYYIPSDGMKFVILDAPFTWIEGVERIGHRPLLEVEKRGFFQAYVRLGRAMNIQGLTDSYEEMRAWFKSQAWANTAHEAIKTDTFETIVKASLHEMAFPGADQLMFLAARAAMEESYLAALAYPAPTPEELASVRSVFFTLGRLLEAMPRSTFIRTVQNNPVRKGGGRPEELGVKGRSDHVPVLDASRPNSGYPDKQLPIADAKGIAPLALPELSWEEVRRHTTLESLWVVLEGEVYDLTGWAKLHPGGADILLTWAGQDATERFQKAPHTAATQVFKLNFRIGRVAQTQTQAEVA